MIWYDLIHAAWVGAQDILEYTRSLHRDRRAELFRTWGSLWAMLPKVS
jgi:hypothetical protein